MEYKKDFDKWNTEKKIVDAKVINTELNHEDVKSWVVLSQIKAISTKRLLRKIGSISEVDFKEVVLKLRNLI